MAVDIFAAAGVFDTEAEQTILRRVFKAFCSAIDATDDPRVASIMGVMLHVLPANRVTMGGVPKPSVRIDVALPAIALSTFRRRRQFIEEATQHVANLASDPSIKDSITVRILHTVDGGWGTGGHAITNDEIDEHY